MPCLPTANPALLVMVHQLPENGDVQVTALNFGPEAVAERVEIPAEGSAVDMRTGESLGPVTDGQFAVALEGYGWWSVRVEG